MRKNKSLIIVVIVATAVTVISVLVLLLNPDFFSYLKEEEQVIEKEGKETKEEQEEEVEEIPEEGSKDISGPEEDYTYVAILKSFDLKDNTIDIRQLTGGLDEGKIGPTLELASNCKIMRIIIIRSDESEKEYIKEISLNEVAIGTEIGIMFKGGLASTIISSILLDTAIPVEVEELKPAEGEYMVSALLKGMNLEARTLKVEQLINEPNEKIIDPVVSLASDCKAYKSILVISDAEMKEYTKEISIREIPLGTEIALGFTKDYLVRIIISQEWVED